MDDAVVDTATLENETELLELTGATGLTFNSSGATTSAARAIGWQNGAEAKYWSTKVNSTGYKQVLVSVKLRSSTTGPKDFSLQYRLDESSAWLDVVGGTVTVADNFTTGFLELIPLPAEANDQEVLFLRLVMISNQSVNGGTVTSTGSNRLDDFIITATPLTDEPEDPEPGDQCTGEDNQIFLNEIFPYPAVSDQEYAELFNSGDQCVVIAGWRLEDAGGHKYIFPAGTIIESQEYFALTRNLFLNNTSGDHLSLFNQGNEKVAEVFYDQAIKGLGYSFDTANSEWRFTSFLTPGRENIFNETDESTEEENKEPGSDILLSEVFPNPKEDEGAHEFIELENTRDEDQDISGWSILDASKKVFTLPEDTIIPAQGFLVLTRSQFTFALNNSGTESLTLLDAHGNAVSEVSFTNTQEGFTYSFDESVKEWRWTKKRTPGSKNQFSKIPKLTIRSRTEGFVDIPLSFQVDIKNAKGPYRYSWDFGDGRRSTLPEPKHAFDKADKYKASVTVRSKDQFVKKDFIVTIKKYPHHPVLITALLPNPKGKDSGQEWIEIKNLSQKKINLLGWKIATGTDDLTNHTFKKAITLMPEEVLRLTRSDALFTLPNTVATIELRYPNDQVASRARYQEDKIREDSICLNSNENCDFPYQKNKQGNKKKEQGPKYPTTKEERLSQESGETYADISEKEALIRRIGRDVNLLINQTFLETFYKEE